MLTTSKNILDAILISGRAVVTETAHIRAALAELSGLIRVTPVGDSLVLSLLLSDAAIDRIITTIAD